jgi:hypothetical protein
MSLRGSRVGGVPTDEGIFGTGALNENIVGVIVRAAMSGEDASAPAGFRNVPIAARATAADGGEVDALIRLLVSANLRVHDGTATTIWQPLYGDIPGSYAAAGRSTASIRGLWANAIANGIDNTGAAVLRPVEARDAVASADFTASLIGLLTNSRLSAFSIEGSDWTPIVADDIAFYNGSAPSSRAGVLVNAQLIGMDTSATLMRAIEARNADVNGDFAGALIGLLINSRLGVFDRGGLSDWAFLTGDLGSNVAGISPTLTRGAYVNATLVGHDNAGAVVMRVPEARNYDTSSDVAAALIGLLVNSRLAIPDSGSLAWFLSAGSRETPSGETSFAGFVEGRESGYHSSNRGRRFIATSQTAGATLTAQAAFVATTPTLMLRQAAGATETEVVRSISISSFATLPAGIRVVVMLDPDDRFSAGGTSVTPQNPNEGSAAASGITSFLENPTATAADADERIIYNEGFAGGIGAKLVLEFKDELILAGVGTILVYVFDSAGATAPTIAYNWEWEEFV